MKLINQHLLQTFLICIGGMFCLNIMAMVFVDTVAPVKDGYIRMTEW